MNVDVVPTVIYSGMLGMTVFALVQSLSRPKQRQTVYLTALFVLLAIHILGELFITSGAYQYAPSLAGAQFPLRMLLGPAMYFYARATMVPEQHITRRSYAVAMLGPIIVTAIMLPFVFVISSEQKLALADPSTRDPQLWRIAITTCIAAFGFFIAFTGMYLMETLKVHARHRLQLMERFSDIENRSMDWFKVMLVVWGIAWLLYAFNYVSVMFNWRWPAVQTALPVIEAIILTVFAHLSLKQPVLKDTDKGAPTTAENRQPTLTDTRMAFIADKLTSAMNDNALYQQEELTLNRLSNAIDVSENHISETLSQYLQTNFYQFVNRYRIEEAKRLLKSTENPITTIAFDVGFKSKSTFNAAFKKLVGSTPSAFRLNSSQAVY